ncbi:hypothetical protein FA13DRAFT_543119 [Coprinellus micaceus]|uniref:Uncharacterized protein n=1 Tax=Coprinellus micaceus TaxID=71717 RepID=A0A4Y7T8N5_COPMI|nr:hypothetical protein FA13DRAFT_543119 [Coprinellus micaceus]
MITYLLFISIPLLVGLITAFRITTYRAYNSLPLYIVPIPPLRLPHSPSSLTFLFCSDFCLDRSLCVFFTLVSFEIYPSATHPPLHPPSLYPHLSSLSPSSALYHRARPPISAHFLTDVRWLEWPC